MRGAVAVLVLNAVCITGAMLCASTASLQAAPDPSAPFIAAPAEVRATPSVATPMPVTIGPAQAIPANVLFLVRDLPRGSTISGGQPLSDAAWVVPLSAAPMLEITPGPNAAGTTDVVLQLVTYEGAVLARARVKLVVGAPTGAAPVSGMLAHQDIPRPPDAPSPQDMQRAIKFMKKGDENLRSGNISAARLFYQRAADLRMASAALALGATYDADELRRVEVLGVMQADPKEARKWYEKARELGDPEADRRLARLGGR